MMRNRKDDWNGVEKLGSNCEVQLEMSKDGEAGQAERGRARVTPGISVCFYISDR